MFVHRIRQLYWLLRFLILKPLYNSVGRFSYIAPALIILGRSKIKIGNKVRIMPNARIECIGEASELIIGDNISAGPNLSIISGSDNALNIMSDTTISANVFICNVEHDYRYIDKHIMEQTLIKKKTVIGKGCFIGYGAMIQAGTILGQQCVVGANSVVKGIFPNFCVIAGNPAKIIKRYDSADGIWKKTDVYGNII